MNPAETFAAGIAPMHVSALVAAMLLPVLVLVVRRLRSPMIPEGSPSALSTVYTSRPRQPDTVRRWVAWLLGIAAAVHLALPLGHLDGVLLTLAYVGSGAAYAWLALRAYEGRSYRLFASLLLIATLVAYLVVSGAGGEEPDQVGIATALVELLALGLCLVPLREPLRRRRFARFAGSTTTIFTTFVVGIAVWLGTIAAHAATDADVSADPAEAGATLAHTDDHGHAHDHAGRAQAGIIMRPQAGHHPTVEQTAAAQALADATTAAMARFARLSDAIAAGFVVPANASGTDVHIENPRFKQDGRVLDPERPETLVYAIEGGRATLLGVVYVMEAAGVPAPQPGGPITRWHAHNLCLTALPPGFGVVSPFGSCPALSLNLTTPEMMHVWVVENPGGAFAEGLDAGWVRAYHADHGLPITG
jgi:hypothetical protein